MGAGATSGKARIAPRGAGVMMAQKQGAIDKYGDAVEVVNEGEADAEDDAANPHGNSSWTKVRAGVASTRCIRQRAPTMCVSV